MSTNLNCPSCGIVTVVLIDAKVRTTGVACYCKSCDEERNILLARFAASSRSMDGDFGFIFGKGKF